MNEVLLAALSLVSTPDSAPPSNLHQPAPISLGPAALSLILSAIAAFPIIPNTSDSGLASFPHRAAVTARRAFGSDGEAEERLVFLLEGIGRSSGLSRAAEDELAEAIADGEVGEGSEVEGRLLRVLSKGRGVDGLLDGLEVS